MAERSRGTLAFAIVAGIALLMALMTIPRLVTAWRADAVVDAVALEPSVWSELVANGEVSGPAEASLTLVVFGDYECAACAIWNAQIEAFVARHRPFVKIVWRNLPLEAIHRRARQAAD